MNTPPNDFAERRADIERTAFESWACRRFGRGMVVQASISSYASGSVHDAWSGWQAHAALTAPTFRQNMDARVTRFLGWPLPADFAPDGGIAFTKPTNPHGWPIGTHLLNATQARAMLEYVLADSSQPANGLNALNEEIDRYLTANLQDTEPWLKSPFGEALTRRSRDTVDYGNADKAGQQAANNWVADALSTARDAARYRWLRAQHCNAGGYCVTKASEVKLGGQTYALKFLDEVVDMCMPSPGDR